MRAVPGVLLLLIFFFCLAGVASARACRRDVDCQTRDVGFCAPVHRCHRATGECQIVVPGPCLPHTHCDAGTQQCVPKECARDSDCRHAAFCTGQAVCDKKFSTCLPGASPCSADQRCDERQRACLDLFAPVGKLDVRGEAIPVTASEAEAFFNSPFFIAFAVVVGVGILLCLISYCLCNAARRRRKPTIQEVQARESLKFMAS